MIFNWFSISQPISILNNKITFNGSMWSERAQSSSNSVLTVIVVIRFIFARWKNIFNRTAALLNASVGGNDFVFMSAKFTNPALNISLVWVTRPHKIGVYHEWKMMATWKEKNIFIVKKLSSDSSRVGNQSRQLQFKFKWPWIIKFSAHHLVTRCLTQKSNSGFFLFFAFFLALPDFNPFCKYGHSSETDTRMASKPISFSPRSLFPRFYIVDVDFRSIAFYGWKLCLEAQVNDDDESSCGFRNIEGDSHKQRKP